jgi:hypothetical protein
MGITVNFKFTRGDRVQVLAPHPFEGKVSTLRYGADGAEYFVTLFPRSGASAWYREDELELIVEPGESSQPAVPPEE